MHYIMGMGLKTEEVGAKVQLAPIVAELCHLHMSLCDIDRYNRIGRLLVSGHSWTKREPARVCGR